MSWFHILQVNVFKSTSLDIEVRLREALVQGEQFGYPCRTATAVAFELLKDFFDKIEKSQDGAFHQLYEILFDSVFPGLMRNGTNQTTFYEREHTIRARNKGVVDHNKRLHAEVMEHREYKYTKQHHLVQKLVNKWRSKESEPKSLMDQGFRETLDNAHALSPTERMTIIGALWPTITEDEAGTILSDLVPRMLETNRIPNSKLVSVCISAIKKLDDKRPQWVRAIMTDAFIACPGSKEAMLAEFVQYNLTEQTRKIFFRKLTRELSLDELANLIDQLSHVPQVADSDLQASRCVERLQAINSMRPSSRDIVLRGAKRHIST